MQLLETRNPPLVLSTEELTVLTAEEMPQWTLSTIAKPRLKKELGTRGNKFRSLLL
jgi:hypothetical protein